jgi:DNA recombination protein RmuC
MVDVLSSLPPLPGFYLGVFGLIVILTGGVVSLLWWRHLVGVRFGHATFQQNAEAEARHLNNALTQQKELHDQQISFLEREQKNLQVHFQSLAQEALKQNNENFLLLAKEQLNKTQQDAQHTLLSRQKAIETLLEPMKTCMDAIQKQHLDLNDKHTTAYSSLKTEIKSLMDLQNTVTGETQKLVEALRKPQVRGRWGEMTLRRVLEQAGMMMHCDFVEQDGQRDADQKLQRPDVVMHLPGNRYVILDAKVPFDAYYEVVYAKDQESRQIALDRHVRHVMTHVKLLTQKAYWQQYQNKAPEFVILFMPLESAFVAAIEQDPDLLAKTWEQRIILATPSTLMATLMAIAHSWKQHHLADHVEKAAEIARELYGRLQTFAGHLQDVGTHMQRSNKSYNQAVASFQTRLLPKARQFQTLALSTQDPKEIALKEVDETITPLLEGVG